MIEEKIFETGEIRLNYAEGGTKGKPVMVFLHGLTGRWQAYQDDFVTYGQDWHLYAPDLRGHGKSGKPEAGYLLPDYARDVITFLREVVQEPVVLVGHSLGAVVTLTVSATAPEWVRAAIANDPPLLGDGLGIDDYPGPKMWFSWIYEAVKGKPSFEQVLEACKKANPEIGEDDLRGMAEQVAGVAAGTVLVALEDRQKESYDLQGGLRATGCPMLLLYGDFEHGSVVREQDAGLFKQLAPKAVVRKVAKGGHMLWWEQAEETRKHVQEFLGTIE